MAASVRERIIEMFDKMGMDNDCDAARIRSHYILCYFHYIQDRGKERFCKITAQCNHEQIPVPDVIKESALDFALFSKYETLLSDEGLWASVAYMSVVCPWLVADRERLARCAASLERNADSRIDLAVLYAIRKLDDGLSSPKKLSEGDKNFCENVLRIPMAVLSEVWNAICSRPCPKAEPISISRQISAALKAYNKFRIPYAKMLQDALEIQTHKKELEKAINPWEKLQQIHNRKYESGVTAEETAFLEAFESLKEVDPVDLIRAVYYKGRNDSALECSIVWEQFISAVRGHEEVLIVNPSPDFLRLTVNYMDGFAAKISFAVTDDTVAGLYKLAYKKGKLSIFPIPETPPNKYDYLLILARDYPFTETEWKGILDAGTQDCRFLAAIPSVILDSSRQTAAKLLQNAGAEITAITLLPSVLTQSSPRKKLLVEARKPQKNDHTPISCREIAYQKEKDTLIPSWGTVTFRQESFWQDRRAIQSLYESKLQQMLHPDEDRHHRDVTEVYDFSDEIKLRFSVFENRKNRIAARAYYAAIVRGGEQLIHGKRVTESIEKGLRVSSRDELEARLENAAFDERIAPYIVSDIRDFYTGKYTELSLKTIWFCCRENLKKNGYDDSKARELFEGKGLLSDLYPESAFTQDYQTAMAQRFSTEWEQIPLTQWRLLDTIMAEAVRQKYVRMNPLTSIMELVSKRASQSQMEVRNALTKKSFTVGEEKKLLAILYKKKKSGAVFVKRCVAESIWLTAAIRFFTGMTVREVCALQWSDLKEVAGSGVWQFSISKTAADDGTPTSITGRKDKNQIRLVPIPKRLRDLLLERKEFLKETFPLALQEDCPIVLRKEPEISLPNQCAPVPCIPKSAAAKCAELIKELDIPENIITMPDESGDKQTNLSQYNGDIFASNFKYRARHSCALTNGELNYVLGIEPPTTFDRHYCDYSNDLVQMSIAKKLNRWASSLFAKPAAPINRDLKKYDSVPAKEGVRQTVELTADLSELPMNAEFSVTVSTRNGYLADAVLYEKGGKKDGA